MIFRWSSLRPRKLHAIHPEWRVGQYVTYFLERSDGTWTAFAIRIEAQTEDGAWILRGDFKTSRGESTEWLRSDPRAKANDIDPVPLGREVGRHMPAETPEQLADDPSMQLSLAMNLLLVRRDSTAVTALDSRPRPVQYP